MTIRTIKVSDLKVIWGSLNTRIAASAASRDFATSSLRNDPIDRRRLDIGPHVRITSIGQFSVRPNPEHGCSPMPSAVVPVVVERRVIPAGSPFHGGWT